MSLYYEAAAAVANKDRVGGSLKARLYANKISKHSPAQVYALVTETSKWSAILKEVIDKSGLLKAEKKLTDVIALFLVHDHLLSKKGIAASQNHPLHLAILRHRSRLNAEFTKLRIRHGFPTLAAMRKSIEEQASSQHVDDRPQHPRWLRINLLKTTLENELQTTFVAYERTGDLHVVLSAPKHKNVFLIDENVESLIALPPEHDIHKSEAYKDGRLIFQDKASCFPASLLDPHSFSGDIIDACSAPGNKTTHLAALLDAGLQENGGRRIFAFERDRRRSEILRKMVAQAGANKTVSIHASTDFLQTQPSNEIYATVTGILLDPSCSGSGIVGRDDEVGQRLAIDQRLPAAKNQSEPTPPTTRSRKRKLTRHVVDVEQNFTEESPSEEADSQAAGASRQRLEALSTFQLKLLQHCMAFPAARRIVYSTCSVHVEENERVVVQALCSSVARSGGWRILLRERQIPRMRAWTIRGLQSDCEHFLSTFCREMELSDTAKEIADACIRCEKGTSAGTMGFFVAGFVRDNLPEQQEYNPQPNSEEEWNGFSDSE